MEPDVVTPSQSWVMSFLGIVNYYQHFVRDIYFTPWLAISKNAKEDHSQNILSVPYRTVQGTFRQPNISQDNYVDNYVKNPSFSTG